MAVKTRLLRLRDRVSAQGLRKTALYLMFTVFGERAGVEVNALFRLRDELEPAERPDQTFEIARRTSDLEPADIEALTEYGGPAFVESFTAAFARGEQCVIGRAGGVLAAVCWVIPCEGYGGAVVEPAVTIERCFTLPAYRGQGFFPNALRFLNHALAERTDDGKPPIFIEASVFNEASVRGITKSGCQRVGTKISVAGRETFIGSPPRPRA